MKLHLYRKTVKLQLYGMINTLQLIFMATLATNGLAMTDSPSESPPDKIIIRHTEVEVEKDRYFKLDKTKKESILDQFRTQATETYHAYKDHCINQKKFLEMLVIKDITVKPDELQSVHP